MILLTYSFNSLDFRFAPLYKQDRISLCITGPRMTRSSNVNLSYIAGWPFSGKSGKLRKFGELRKAWKQPESQGIFDVF